MVSFEQTIVNQLCTVNKTLIDIKDKLITSETRLNGTYNSLKYSKVKSSWFLEKLITFSGSTTTVNIDLLELIKALQKTGGELPGAFKINRIEQIFNDPTARGYSIRIYTNPAIDAYIEIDADTADTSLNISIEGEYKVPAEFRIQFYYSNFTAGKTARIRVQVDEI